MSYGDAKKTDATGKFNGSIAELMTSRVVNAVNERVYANAEKNKLFAILKDQNILLNHIGFHILNCITKLYETEGENTSDACMRADIVNGLDRLIQAEATTLYDLMHPCVFGLWKVPPGETKMIEELLAQFVASRLDDSIVGLIAYVKRVHRSDPGNVTNLAKALFGKSELYDRVIERTIQCGFRRSGMACTKTSTELPIEVTASIDKNYTAFLEMDLEMEDSKIKDFLKEDAMAYMIGLDLCSDASDDSSKLIETYIDQLLREKTGAGQIGGRPPKPLQPNRARLTRPARLHAGALALLMVALFSAVL
jgi:hypothetical protein